MEHFPLFRDTVRERAALEPAFRQALLVEAGRAVLENDIDGTRSLVADSVAGLMQAELPMPSALSEDQREALLDLSRDLPAEAVLAALSACLAHEGIELTVKQRTPRGRRKAATERLPAAAE